VAIRGAGALALAVCALWAWAVWQAPVDAMQGPIQKILYVHVPAAIGAYLGFLTTALCSALYLRRGDERWDRLAVAAAEVGVVFCSLNIASGPIWARGTWGHWWAWDPRLTVTLLLWFIYLAYLLLRAFTEGASARRSQRSWAARGPASAQLLAIRLRQAAMHPDNQARQPGGCGFARTGVLRRPRLRSCAAALRSRGPARQRLRALGRARGLARAAGRATRPQQLFEIAVDKRARAV
jgi:ABC-type transport system involved in cytochrome c biogenesis permease subunit